MDNDAILSVLADLYCRKILSATWNKELSAIQLSQELKIPLATVYRKIKLLEELGFIKAATSIIKPSGNEEKFYKCTVKRVKVDFNGGKLDIKVEFEEVDKFVRLWKTLSGKMVAVKRKGD
jgi:predicted transcriptional regulator